MKKYLFVLSFVILALSIKAAEDEGPKDSISVGVPLVQASVQASDQAKTPEEIMQELNNNPQGVEMVGGFKNLFTKVAVPKQEAVQAQIELLVRNNEDLRRAAQDSDAIRRALGEAQVQRDAAIREKEQKEAEHTALRARIAVLEKGKKDLLINLDQKSAIAALEEQRRQELTVKNRELSESFNQVAQLVNELGGLEAATADLEVA
ncbi:MAG: hypothetical protein K2Y18_03420 [Alphaproteobacteria bacterium]|jgi:hypothetical protein|nr:hypothetical protein [Alphaproteobacteria bacterium]